MFALFEKNKRVTEWMDDPDVFDSTHPRELHSNLRLVECKHPSWKAVGEPFRVPTYEEALKGRDDEPMPFKKECLTCGYRPHEA